MTKDYEILKFNPKTINDRRMKSGPPTCVFIGKRGTGKSTLVSDILYYSRDIPIGSVISATEEGNHYYQQFVPELFIHNEYSPELIEQIVSRQKKVLKENKNDKDAFLLLDDCMYDKRIMKDKNIKGVFFNGRHWRLLFFLTMQYCMGIPPDFRTNIDYVFCLRDNNQSNQKKLYDHYFGIFPSFDEFKTVMNNCTEGYDCLVLDNTARSNNVKDCVFWYRAKPDRKFKIGAKEIWDFNTQRLSNDVGSPQNKKLETSKVKKVIKKKNTKERYSSKK